MTEQDKNLSFIKGKEMPADSNKGKLILQKPEWETNLALNLIGSYVFFIMRRPISQSNRQFLKSRVKQIRQLASLISPSSNNDLNLDHLLGLLESFNVDNYRKVGDEIMKFVREAGIRVANVPSDVLVVEKAPAGYFSREFHRVLLLMGPAIGIGDEITFFGLPMMIQQALGNIKIEVASSYNGLWDDVCCVNAIHYYNDDLSEPFRLFAIPPKNTVPIYDLTIIVDFEHPQLHYCFFDHPHITHYAEIALASYSGLLVDNMTHKLYRFRNHHHYQNNTYSGINHLLGALLGIKTGQPIFKRLTYSRAAMKHSTIQIMVNPFSTKFDPMPDLWSCIIREMASLASNDQPIDFLVNTGISEETEAFVSELVDQCDGNLNSFVSVKPLLKGDQSGKNRFLLLPDMLKKMSTIDAIIGTDSFTAHMAPLFETYSLVIGESIHIPWHVPNQESFYFDHHVSRPELIEGMKYILQKVLESKCHLAPKIACEHITLANRLNSETVQLGAYISGIEFSDADELSSMIEKFDSSRKKFLKIALQTPGLSKILIDREYPDTIKFDFLHKKDEEQDSMAYLYARWEEWNNSNLRKYINLVSRDF